MQETKHSGRATIPARETRCAYGRLRPDQLQGGSGGRGDVLGPGQRSTRLLLEVLCDRESDVLVFAHDLRVPATSNQAERDLRPAKLAQKISGRHTSLDCTKDRYCIRGYTSTAAKHGITTFAALHRVIAGRPWMPPSPAPI